MLFRKTITDSQQQGIKAEQQAKQYLLARKMFCIEQNFNCRLGEIDLIMQDGQELVFVEVRYRHNNNYGSALDSVDHRKQAKISKAAMYYLQKYPQYGNLPCRFDVIAIEGSNSRIAWIKNAFYSTI